MGRTTGNGTHPGDDSGGAVSGELEQLLGRAVVHVVEEDASHSATLSAMLRGEFTHKGVNSDLLEVGAVNNKPSATQKALQPTSARENMLKLMPSLPIFQKEHHPFLVALTVPLEIRWPGLLLVGTEFVMVRNEK
jgi:hypothetical protein